MGEIRNGYVIDKVKYVVWLSVTVSCETLVVVTVLMKPNEELIATFI
jgi:hypothetical protein